MDQPKYTTLAAALMALLDPRKARGKRYAWILLLTNGASFFKAVAPLSVWN